MKLTIERRGGIAGLKASFAAATDSLSPVQQEALARLLESPPAGAHAPGADRFHFKIIVDRPDGRREYEVGEDEMPDVLARLVKSVI